MPDLVGRGWVADGRLTVATLEKTAANLEKTAGFDAARRNRQEPLASRPVRSTRRGVREGGGPGAG
ncbi:hypothetical protein SUDANB95_01000 [Actinosynnema sp. ALI-1.44]